MKGGEATGEDAFFLFRLVLRVLPFSLTHDRMGRDRGATTPRREEGEARREDEERKE